MSLQWQRLSIAPDAAGEFRPEFFDSSAWAGAVACLGARCWKGFDPETNQRISLFVWQKGPVRIGYLGFPVSPAWLLCNGTCQLNPEFTFPERVDFVRANFSLLDLATVNCDQHAGLPESAIPDLSVRLTRNQRKIRKDLAVPVRHGVTLSDATQRDASNIFSTYQQTVSRRQGRLRYTEKYFRELISISEIHQDIQVRLACHQRQAIGFCVSVCNGKRGYYLHAGIGEGWRHLGAADLLVDDSIRWATSKNCREFSLMASPAEQTGLHKFKQKWAEQDGQWITVDKARGLLGGLSMLALALGN